MNMLGTISFSIKRQRSEHWQPNMKDQPLTVDQALVKGLVNVTKATNTSKEVFSDVITGKGGGLVRTLFYV
jgi:hypothetical protein